MMFKSNVLMMKCNSHTYSLCCRPNPKAFVRKTRFYINKEFMSNLLEPKVWWDNYVSMSVYILIVKKVSNTYIQQKIKAKIF